MSQYYCIFKTSVSTEITNTSDVKTVSGCSCHGYCSSHSDESEGLLYIQDRCIGHRLTSSNAQGKNIPSIASKDYVTHTQYNLLVDLINTELNNRRKSPLYSNVQKDTVPDKAKTKTHITKQQISQLNNFIASQHDFYKDEATVPTNLDTVANEIKSIDINKTIAAVKNLLNDCVCYADCNGYSACTCYGHCNHY